MARSEEQRIGYLRGPDQRWIGSCRQCPEVGRNYRIDYGHRNHLCHPSLGNIDAVKR